MRKFSVFSQASAGVVTLSAAAFYLALVGCGSATTSTPVQAASPIVAATTVPVVPVAAAVVGQAKGDWGSIKGQIVADGAVASLKLLVTKGDAGAKDSSVCAAQDVPDESLVVDAKSGGIANVVIYLQKKPAKVHPDLEKSKEKEVLFDQKGCQFLPHVLLVRNDQQVRVKSDDAVAHNTHTYPLKNKQENFVVSPNDRTGVAVPSVTLAERLPAKVGCDIHPWMQAYWMVVDHPYAAVTDKDGKFSIPNLPVGEHEFRVWHERKGYLERKYSVKVLKGDNALKPVEVKIADLKGDGK